MKEGMISIFRFFAFLLFLPLIIATAFAFETRIFGLPVSKEQWFFWGLLVFVLAYLFLYDFKDVYAFGQNIVTNLLKSAGSVATAAGFVVPIYTVLIICVGLVFNILGLAGPYEGWLVFAVAFSLALHIVSTAHQLYEADKTPLKADYFFGFGLAFIATVFLVSLLFGLAVPEFSFMGFFHSLAHHAGVSYHKIYKVLI